MVDSSVCRAAIHTGVLTNEGGLIELVKGPKTKMYEGSENRGVVSNKYDEYALSFTVTKAINLHIELSESFKNRKLIFTKDK